MDIILIIFRNIVVHHKSEIVYLQASCRHIRGHKEVDFTFLHPFQGLKPLGLGHISHKIFRLISIHVETLGYLNGHILGIGEYETGLGIYLLQNGEKHSELLFLSHMVELLCNVLDSDLLRLDLNLLRIIHVVPCQIPYLCGEGCRKEHGLPSALVSHHAEHIPDVWIEAHVEHSVSFIKDHDIKLSEIDLSGVSEVQETAWCPYIEIQSLLQLCVLSFISYSAIEASHSVAIDS